jgi:hypothetical protein
VRFAYEWHNDSGKWFRSYGNENWEFDDTGLKQRRVASINDLPIEDGERKFHWLLGRGPDDHPSLSDLARLLSFPRRDQPPGPWTETRRAVKCWTCRGAPTDRRASAAEAGLVMIDAFAHAAGSSKARMATSKERWRPKRNEIPTQLLLPRAV